METNVKIKVLKYLIKISIENQIYESAAFFRNELYKLSGSTKDLKNTAIGPKVNRNYELTSNLDNIEEYELALELLNCSANIMTEKHVEKLSNILKRYLREEKIGNILNEKNKKLSDVKKIKEFFIHIYAKEITNNIKSVEKLEDFLNNTEGGVKYKIWESRSVKIDKLLDENEDIG